MGLFDTVFCRYPLPHHQDAEFQTKDLANLVTGESMLGGLMDEYEITVEGGLRLRAHEREYVEDRTAVFGGYFTSVRDWWEDVPDVHGDVRIYTGHGVDGVRGRVEFRIRFTNGRVQDVKEVERAAPSLER